MNNEALKFIAKHAGKLQGRVIEIGSRNVNGSARKAVKIAVGVDIHPGPGVDLVCPVENLLEHFAPGEFDGCVSVDTLEHVQDWKGFVRTTWALVKEGGHMVFTMASMDKGRHAYPDDYWRLTEQDIYCIWPNAEGYEYLNKPGKKAVSIGWVIKKEGELGDLEFTPYQVP